MAVISTIKGDQIITGSVAVGQSNFIFNHPGQRSIDLSGSLIIRQSGSNLLSPTGSAVIFYDRSLQKLQVSQNGTASVDLVNTDALASHVIHSDPHTVYEKGWDKGLVTFIKGNIGGANVSSFPGIWPAPQGTAQFRGFGATFFQQQNRTGYTTTAVSASMAAGIRCNAYWNGGFNVSGTGGYKMVSRWGISDAVFVSTARIRCAATTQNAIGDVEPYGATDLSIGIACDGLAGETNFYAFCNTYNTPTKINLGPNFPANTTGVDWYECTILRESNSLTASITLERLNTGHIITVLLSGSSLPSVTTNHAFQLNRSNGGTAAAVGIDFDFVHVRGGPNP